MFVSVFARSRKTAAGVASFWTTAFAARAAAAPSGVVIHLSRYAASGLSVFAVADAAGGEDDALAAEFFSLPAPASPALPVCCAVELTPLRWRDSVSNCRTPSMSQVDECAADAGVDVAFAGWRAESPWTFTLPAFAGKTRFCGAGNGVAADVVGIIKPPISPGEKPGTVRASSIRGTAGAGTATAGT